MTLLDAPILRLRPRRPDLIVRPLGNAGEFVVKDPRTGEYYNLGPEESFLFHQLDGQHSAGDICAAFEREFEQPLPESDLHDFLEMLDDWRLLKPDRDTQDSPDKSTLNADAPDEERTATVPPPTAASDAEHSRSESAPAAAAAPASEQSILFWRKSVFDPDRLFNWLEPRIRFVWSRAFVAVSAGCILLAALFVWTERQTFISQFPAALRWETWLLAWMILCLVTTLHEFAHGLTCKHFGGEVHEVGFLLLFFIPCLYCNVSDAWLIREKSKRLYVTLAGGYCDLICWTIAVFVWRVTVQDSLVNYLAWVVLAVCGIRSFFNFNPLIKLDGYYLLSDALEIRNLRQRAWDLVLGRFRWALWGATAPASEPRAGFLLIFGLAAWAYSLLFLTLMFIGLFHLGSYRLGRTGIVLVAILAVLVGRSVFVGVSQGEVRAMLFHRRKRTFIWALVILALALSLYFIRMEQRASGSFEVRATVRNEVRATVAGFLREVSVEEGALVEPGDQIGLIEVPDLASKTEQKRAEVHETQARLELLQAGARQEEIGEQMLRVQRAQRASDMARQDLEHAREALAEELARLEQLIQQRKLESEQAIKVLENSQDLFARSALANFELEQAEMEAKIASLRWEQAQAEYRARKVIGARADETRLAQREQELAEARGALALLSLGPRAEELNAARAQLARLEEELRYLESLSARTILRSSSAGVVATPFLAEKVNQYFREGEPICLIEEPSSFVTQITLPEEQVAAVKPGQRVQMKFRALPYETYTGKVERIAPAAAKPDEFSVQSHVTIYCRLDSPPPNLRSGMTGYARIHCGKRAAGALLSDGVLRFLRTEFWW